MTAEYAFLNAGFDLKINSDLMTRAVRVKETVKDKIGKVFEKMVTSVVEEKASTSVETKVSTLDTLIDLSEEGLEKLNAKVNSLMSQSKIEVNTRRVVLFTSGLYSKIKDVTSKWLVSKIEETKVAEEEHDSIVPSTWDEYVPAAESAVEVKSPVAENVPFETKEEETKEVEMPELNTSFRPEVEEPANISNIEKDEDPVSIQNNMTFEMPNLFGNREEAKYVAEPKLVAEEEKEEKVTEDKTMSIEDRIAELLRRTEVTKEEVEEKKEETPVLSQSAIMARVQRVNNSMKDKDAKISSLEGRLDAANREIATQRTKINGYEAVVKDLTVKNNSLTTTNDTLNTKLTETESEYETKIVGLEEQLESLAKSKQDETNDLNNRIVDMEKSHSEEIRELKERHAREIASLKETNEKKIEAIYKTISEALGDSYQPEEDYSKAA